ncbi:hypothetical protein CQW23_08807 [Capsicum baccatum]|uniref:Uncharacterized protein n=1 Tax=Capsicum baccatum TaxID=33114 RepID=A0A2G2XA29_CAPBA|nr:hypothetical protein CQW23_08807 [Capsicum baccatum]
MLGSDGMLGRGFTDGFDGKVIFGTEVNLGKDETLLGNNGDGGIFGKLGIEGNCGSVGRGNDGMLGELGSCSKPRAA